MRRQVEEWRARQISTVAAKLIIYQAFVESELDAPKHLARQVHDLYFRPTHPEFEHRTLWSLTNAFTSAFKELEPIPQFRATASSPASSKPYGCRPPASFNNLEQGGPVAPGTTQIPRQSESQSGGRLKHLQSIGVHFSKIRQY